MRAAEKTEMGWRVQTLRRTRNGGFGGSGAGAGKTHPGETARVLCGCSDLNPQCTPADCARGHDGRVYTGATPATHDVPNHRVVEASRSTGLCGRANRYGPCGPVPFSAAGRHDGPAALSPQRPERRMAEAAALPARFVL